MGTNQGLSEKELLNVISKLENALNNVIDKAEDALNSNNNTTGGNNTSVATSRAFKHFNFSSSNPYDENGEEKKFKEYEKYAQDRSKTESNAQKEKIANEMAFWELNKQQITELSKYENELQLKRHQAEINFFRDKETEIRELDELEVSLMKARHEKDLKARKRALELEKKTTDNKWRTKSNKEWEEAKANWNQNSTGRKAGIITSKVMGGVVSAAKSIKSDEQVSISDVGNKIADIAGNFGPWGKVAGAMVQAITMVVELYDKINKASSDYARSVGGGVAKMRQMKTQATGTATAISSWGGKAYKFDKILEHTAELSKETGRVMDHMSNLDFKSLEDLRQWGIDNSVLNQFDTFGLSMETIDEKIKNIYNVSGKHGLNAKAVTDTVTKNLKLAQQCTFAGGTKALERMAEKSVALKYNIEAAARFADKVSTLEGATQVGAQLSVLGSDFARMGNPLSMLYGGLQDTERLNDMMLNMTKNMAHWDSQNKEMRIDAYNRQRLKAAADAMGVDYNDLINQSMTQGKRNMIDEQLNKTGEVTDNDTLEYIRNIAQVDKEGIGYVTFHENGKERRVNVDELTNADKKQLEKESQRMSDEKNAKIGNVLTETRTITEKLNDIIDTLKAKIVGYLAKIAGVDASEDNYTRGKGLTFDQLSEYNQIKKIGDKKNAKKRQQAVDEADESIKKTLRELGWIDENNILTDKYNDSGRIKHYQTSDEYLKYLKKNDLLVKKEKEPEKKAYGGIVRGKGTSKSDSIPTMLSAGEYVVPSDVAQEHMPQLNAWRGAKGYADGGSVISDKFDIKAGNNQYNHMNVSESAFDNARMNAIMKAIGATGNNKLAIEPININVSGTINLTGGSNSKSFDIRDIFQNPSIMAQLVRKLEESINYGLDKRNIHMKYPEPISLA